MSMLKPNYKIWHFGKTKWDRVVDQRFYALDDTAAYEHYLKFVDSAPNLDGHKFYYSKIFYIDVLGKDGHTHEECDIDDHRSLSCSKSVLSYISNAVQDFFTCWIPDTTHKVKCWVRDIVYLLKNKEEYSNQWNLDAHLLRSIELNVPSLIENSHGLMFLDDAILQLHRDDKDFDLAKYHKDHCMGYPEDVEKLAMEIQNEEYRKLLQHVKLYKYYSEAGFIDYDNKDDVEFDKRWRHTLPLKPGTYDEILDYKRLESMAQEQWNSIWDWMKKHGQKLWD